MPLFYPQAEIDRLHDENERLTLAVSGYEGMGPLIRLATSLREDMVERLDNEDPNLTASAIGELAYRAVMDREIHNVRTDAAARYESEHRNILYDRLLGEVESKEGDDIMAAVRQKVETDPDIAAELRDSARSTLAKRAMDGVKAEISAEESEFIEAEAERQLQLDRLDVEFRIEGELDLHRQDILDIVKPGDVLELFIEQGDRSNGIELMWQRDVQREEGWVMQESGLVLYDNSGHRRDMGALGDRFTFVGTRQKNLVSGGAKFMPNHLKLGEQLAFTDYEGRSTQVRVDQFARSNNYSRDTVVPTLASTDFRTKLVDLAI